MKDRDEVSMMVDLIDAAGLERRWVPGKMCLAIPTPSVSKAIADLIDATAGDLELVEMLADAIRHMQLDERGRINKLMYFPEYRCDSE